MVYSRLEETATDPYLSLPCPEKSATAPHASQSFRRIRHWSLSFITYSEETAIGTFSLLPCLLEIATCPYLSLPCSEKSATGPYVSPPCL
jgi:hypothetical protein